MTVITRSLLLLTLALGAGLAVAACDSTPTVPVPPPEFCAASAPDADDMCTVSCESSTTVKDVALVYNEVRGEGVMRATEPDGSFAVQVAAQEGDDIIVQMKQDNHLSAEIWLVVPAPE
jgi:hypothetical protein